jgi:hypothetical protein
MRKSKLFCPVCNRDGSLSEWRRVFRFVRSGAGNPPAQLFRHTICNKIAYFLLK